MASMQIVCIGGTSAKRHSAEHIGAKAAGLAHMAGLGLPVPPAFVLPIELCAAINANEPAAALQLNDGLREGIIFLENTTGKLFGDRRRPLLLSVRSGAARSMPGMLETVLNIGCTPAAVQGLVRMTGNPRFAWDCRRRFIENFATVVLGVPSHLFADRLAEILATEGASIDQALDSEAIERLASCYQQLVDEENCTLPEDPMVQLSAAAQAVYRSWMSDRARTYRELENLDDLRGTAVTIQAMVFGNRNLSSGAGVAFSRDPSTGASEPVIDVLFAGGLQLSFVSVADPPINLPPARPAQHSCARVQRKGKHQYAVGVGHPQPDRPF
jgi:pyruvate, orthophosphate dikinase